MNIRPLSNSKSKYIRSLSQKKYREEYGEYTVEGEKSVRDALNSARTVTALCVSDTFLEKGGFICPDDVPVYTAPDSEFRKMCDTKTPQGILAVIKIEEKNNFTPDLSNAYVYCDTVSDPGNLGTIIRTADAAGFGAILLSPLCADAYSPKTVRASMGSFFNIPLVTGVTYEKLGEYADMGFTVYAGALGDDTIDYRAADMTVPTIIAVGNEANGISEEVKKISKCVKIPILGRAESLNASVAAAVLMYELLRQRT